MDPLVLHSSEGLRGFRRALIAWGKEHFQAFPWRFEHDPYRVLMAEVMLHRTQARQVLPVYMRFIEQYPTLQSLHQVSIDELHVLLRSLGLNWRIARIHQMLEDLCNNYNCQVPQSKEELMTLPGVSDYISSAVRCFSWNYPEALVDTNTVRVTGRLFGLATKSSSRRNKYLRSLVFSLVDESQAREFNYALLDLAHLVCRNQVPTCSKCPVSQYCIFSAELQDHSPLRRDQ